MHILKLTHENRCAQLILRIINKQFGNIYSAKGIFLSMISIEARCEPVIAKVGDQMTDVPI